jgi:ferredoxin
MDSDTATEDRGAATNTETYTVTVRTGDTDVELDVQAGTILRDALRDAGYSPHNLVTDIVNCGGQGHCATCAVEIVEGDPPAEAVVDTLLSVAGLGRVSCTIPVDRDMVVRL